MHFGSVELFSYVMSARYLPDCQSWLFFSMNHVALRKTVTWWHHLWKEWLMYKTWWGPWMKKFIYYQCFNCMRVYLSVSRWYIRLPWWLIGKEWCLGWEYPLEVEITTHSSILALEVPWTEEAWQAIVHEVAKGQTQLSDYAGTH